MITVHEPNGVRLIYDVHALYDPDTGELTTSTRAVLTARHEPLWQIKERIRSEVAREMRGDLEQYSQDLRRFGRELVRLGVLTRVPHEEYRGRRSAKGRQPRRHNPPTSRRSCGSAGKGRASEAILGIRTERHS